MKKAIRQGKTILALLLCAVMAAGLLPGITGAARAIIFGDYEYKVNADGITVTITRYTGSGGDVTIPAELDEKPVNGIDEKAFQSTPITGLTIPATVTEIGDQAFSNCTGLTSVTFTDGNSTVTLGSGLFEGCTNLKSAHLSDRIISINNRMFYGCSSLSTVEFPNQLTTIGKQAFANTALGEADLSGTKLRSIEDGAFSGCAAIARLELPSTDPLSIEADAFSGCGNIEELVIPASVTSIGSGAFAKSKVKKVIFAEGSSSITLGNGVFQNCQALESAALSSRVNKISQQAFSGCGKLSVEIPESVTSIGNDAFKDCKIAWQRSGSDLRILSTGSIPDYSSAGSAPWYGIRDSIQSVSLNDGITGIGAGAFAGLQKLAGITVPAGVNKIGSEAFADCVSLSDVTVENEKTAFGKDVFRNDTKVKIRGHKNSTAETYASENGVTFESLDWIISFSAGGGSGTMSDQGVVKGQQYTLPSCAFTAPEGKTFDTWDKGAPGTKIDVNGNMVITALWKDKPAEQQQEEQPENESQPEQQPEQQPEPQSDEQVTLKKLRSVKLKAVSKKKIQVSWKKLSSKDRKKIKKIQIQVSTDPEFKTILKEKYVSSKKTSYTIPGLTKNTKYYVRVRAYTEKDGVKHVSEWVAKNKKTKKK